MNLRKILKKAVALASAVSLMPCVFPASAEEQTGEIAVAADWHFGESGVLSGSIEAGDLVIEDKSGNNNNLVMQTYGDGNWSDYLSFSENSMTGSDGSMVFDGDSANSIGADFITEVNAPINSESFENGYTMEFIYYFPLDWTTSDEWMSLIGRQGSSDSISEPEQGTMFTSISNCKEIQFYTANSTDSHTMTSAAWSVTMDRGGLWYHIAVISDGETISTYVNGCESFRDYVSSEMKGMYADPDDGRFRVGSSWWNGIDKFLRGSLQEIRISAQPLEKEDWLVQNPELYIGEYGSNEKYTLKNEDNYNIVLLPDTQNTVEYRPDVMEKAIDELIATADELNVAGVIHLGDVVDDNNDDTQYMNARNIFYKLPDAGIKLLIQQGNHDGWSSGIRNYYNSFSGKSTAFKRRSSWYLTNSPNGDQNSSYMFVRAGNYDYLVVSLSCTGSSSGNENTAWLEADEAWLREVLEEYPNCPTIVTTHDLQNCSETVPSAIKLSSNGEKLWDIVKDYNQVFMLVGGHSHGSGVEVLTNSDGNDVYSILTDYQFAYNGGNGFFRYLEFDESANKIYYSTYSPYAASLDESEKTFFDVNFMTGDGNEGELDLNFETRFASMRAARLTASEGKVMDGEYHTHTGQSKDATSTYMTLENSLAAAFRNEDVLSSADDETGLQSITAGNAFDFIGYADHLRRSYDATDGQGDGNYNTAFYVAVQTQINETEKLQVKGIYSDKIVSSGFEWDMPGLDHASVGILNANGEEDIQGIHAFEWLYASIGDDPTSLYELDGYTDDTDEASLYGERRNNGSAERAYEAVKWLAENYPNSYVLPNHPSRHNGQSGEVTIENLRYLNDASSEIVFGFEGMPGNQMSGDGRCELPQGDIRNGADEMIAVTGGVWDSLLSEGRRFYNFANSDFHFKVSSDEKYSSGYWPSEYSTNKVRVEPGEDGVFDYSDVVAGLKSGNSYSVYGNLISNLEFTASANGNCATMGQDLNVIEDDIVTVTIKFTVPDENNYQTIYGTDTGIEVTNSPSLDHIDLIMGHVTGKLDESEYSSTSNTDAKIYKTFSKEELSAAKGADGFYTLSCQIPADKDLYIRLRGTSVSLVDENGDPYSDEFYNSISDNAQRIDTINDYNYSSLCFYANPIWVNAAESGISLDLSELSHSGNALTGSIIVNLDKITASAGSVIYTAVYSDATLLYVKSYVISDALQKETASLSAWNDININCGGTISVKAIIMGSDGITPLYKCAEAEL